MLNYVKVDGFKSLIGFKLGLNTGLNILVGPNGSGKTNVISFFDFLGNLQEMTASDAVSSAGGAGAVFTKIGEDKYKTNVVCTVCGDIRVQCLLPLNFVIFRVFPWSNFSFFFHRGPSCLVLACRLTNNITPTAKTAIGQNKLASCNSVGIHPAFLDNQKNPIIARNAPTKVRP